MATPAPDPAFRLWRYRGERRDGAVVRGELTAGDRGDAARQLSRMGVTPLDIRPASPGLGSTGRLSQRDALDFSRSLADLVEAGLPLGDALAGLGERERRTRLKAFIGRVEARVRAGAALSDALREDPARPPREMIALTRAGEESGLLGRNLRDLAKQIESDRELRQELVGQMIYPLVLVVLIGATLVFLSFFVLPQFEQVFADARATPPAVTQFVLAAGAFLRAWALWIPIGLVALAAGLRALARLAPKRAEQVLGLVPGLNWLRLRVASVRYCRVLGLLLSTGAPLARAEPVARSGLSSATLRERHAAAAAEVRAGAVLSEALERARVVPADTVRFIRLGEKTGQLDAMLLRAAELHEREVRAVLKRAVELIGPLMIAILGLCVGGVIAAVMSGVLSLNDVVY